MPTRWPHMPAVHVLMIAVFCMGAAGQGATVKMSTEGFKQAWDSENNLFS